MNNAADIVKKIEEEHPDIKVIGEYKGSDTPLEVECLKCGTRWSPRPHSLLSKNKTGCPACGAEQRALHHRKTRETFEEKIVELFDDVIVTGEYVDQRTPIAMKCCNCGHTWESSPEYMTTGKRKDSWGGVGCPKCRKTKSPCAKQKEQDFITKLAEVNPTIEYIGGYKKFNEKVTVRCKNCGHEWQATPHNLLAGSGCPVEARKRK